MVRILARGTEAWNTLLHCRSLTKMSLASSAILHNSVLRNSETNAMQILIKLFQTRIVMMMHEPPVIQATLHNFKL